LRDVGEMSKKSTGFFHTQNDELLADLEIHKNWN